MTQPPDPIDESSRESFPASDAPSWEPLHSGPPGDDGRGFAGWSPVRKAIFIVAITLIIAEPLVWVVVGRKRGEPAVAATVERNVPYVAGGGAEKQLDLATPAGHGFPTVVFVHGGSLTGGDKDDLPYETICANIVAAGAGCARVNYRLAPGAKWPAQPQDVAAAFEWVRHRIAARGGDSTRVFLWGHSSGCLLVSLVGTDPRYLAAQQLRVQAIGGIIAMGCTLDPYDTAGRGMTPAQVQRAFDADRDEQLVYASLADRIAANPYLYVGAALPRMLILVADSERFQPPILEQAEKFQARARAAGAEPEIVILPGRRHQEALDLMADPNDSTLALLIGFIRRVPVDAPLAKPRGEQ